ncbi:hypothetical protein G3T14_08030 [Methylobacterium sp. BTF04]|nr:hypothetical protein [Methylobacterium sp. BTF04]
MKRSLTRTGTLRAVTAVVALYALVLHAFLGGLMPLPSPLHGGALCLGQTDGGGADPDTGGVVHHQPCCTVPGLFAKAEDPVLAAAAIVWPPRGATRIAWRSEVRVAARGPPGSIAHPRGPPTL